MTSVFREAARVRASEIGPDGAMRLPALLDLLQEAAGNSATELGWASDALLAQGKTWILSRFHLRLRALPAWREEIAVQTWPSGAHRVFALREFRATGAGGRLLAEATSGWLLVSVPRSVRSVRRPRSRRLRPAPAPRLPDLFEPPGPGAAAGPVRSLRIGRFDLDLNAHANNVVILRALLEALPGRRRRSLSRRSSRKPSKEIFWKPSWRKTAGRIASPCSAPRTAANCARTP